ncbi:hypothetical protein HY504_01905 [Candidatus Wolfebacteria bacterium]|nr:hypothetical protein [Candidatus Wolfebacteria bacterium]
MFIPDWLLDKLAVISAILANIWWLWLPALLLFIVRGKWLEYRNEFYRRRIPRVLLEIKSPREVIKSAKAMEQILANMHSLSNAPSNWYETYVDGEVPLWFSLEIAGSGSGANFYIYTPAIHQRAIESFLHAQYPDVEVAEVPDYTQTLPDDYGDLAKLGYRLWGTELLLTKDDAYPLRTYLEFESSQAEEENLDPIASLVELFSKCKSNERVWIQLLIRPAGGEWQEEALRVVKKLKDQSTRTITPDEGQPYQMYTMKTPGEIETLKAVERKVAKLSFYTLIRYLYVAPDEAYVSTFARKGVRGAFVQYGSASLNYFRHNDYRATQLEWHFWPFFFAKKRLNSRRRRIYENYRQRETPDENFFSKLSDLSILNFGSFRMKEFVLSIEELATIYHLPTIAVTTAPIMKKIESRRVGPSLGLDIFKEGE